MKWFYILIVFFSLTVDAQILNHKKEFTRQDSLRGSNNEFRNWWNVLHYDIQVEPDFEKRFIGNQFDNLFIFIDFFTILLFVIRFAWNVHCWPYV